jgi:hypothetical protein
MITDAPDRPWYLFVNGPLKWRDAPDAPAWHPSSGFAKECCLPAGEDPDLRQPARIKFTLIDPTAFPQGPMHVL